MEKIFQCLKGITSKIDLKKMFAPSTIAAVCILVGNICWIFLFFTWILSVVFPVFILQIVGFIIGIISPIRKLIVGDSAPLNVISSSAALIGYVLLHTYFGFWYRELQISVVLKMDMHLTYREAAIPSRTLIMGANLLKGSVMFSFCKSLTMVSFIHPRYISN